MASTASVAHPGDRREEALGGESGAADGGAAEAAGFDDVREGLMASNVHVRRTVEQMAYMYQV
jgi:hypothetical protein